MKLDLVPNRMAYTGWAKPEYWYINLCHEPELQSAVRRVSKRFVTMHSFVSFVADTQDLKNYAKS
jgi:hypothetical protein